MRTRKRAAFILASAAALGVGLIAFPAAAAAAPPVVPTCVPKASTGSDSCVRLVVTPLAPPIGGAYENIKLGTRVRSIFQPANHETSSVTLRYDDDIKLNLAGVGTCDSAPTAGVGHIGGKNIASAYASCGPPAGAAHNAYLSPPNTLSGIGSTVPPGNVSACTMIFKGINNTKLLIYARAPVNPTTQCNTAAGNNAGAVTVIFGGNLGTAPGQPGSPYLTQLSVPGTSAANPALDDFYATITRGAVFQARCVGGSDHKIQSVHTYTPPSPPDPPDVTSPPYAGTVDPCP